MSTHVQYELPYGDADAELREIIAEIIDLNGGPQEVAHALGIEPAHLSHAMASRKRHRLWLVPHTNKLVRMHGGRKLLEHWARLCGCQVIDAAPPTVEEEYVALTQVLREHFGDGIRQPLLRAQRRRLIENRGLRAASGDDE